MASKKKGTETDKDTTAAAAADPAVDTAAAAVVDAARRNPPATAEEKAEFAAEKERREKRVIEANEKAMKDGQVTETKNGKTGVAHTKDGGVVIFNTGQFAFVPLKDLPTWVLHHLMADALDIKWKSLTKEQQAEVSKELNRRAGNQSGIDQAVFPPGQGAGTVSDLETVQERRAKEISPIPVGTGPQTPTFGVAEGKEPVTPSQEGASADDRVKGAAKKTSATTRKK